MRANGIIFCIVAMSYCSLLGKRRDREHDGDSDSPTPNPAIQLLELLKQDPNLSDEELADITDYDFQTVLGIRDMFLRPTKVPMNAFAALWLSDNPNLEVLSQILSVDADLLELWKFYCVDPLKQWMTQTSSEMRNPIPPCDADDMFYYWSTPQIMEYLQTVHVD
jgi:hypothetical protein